MKNRRLWTITLALTVAASGAMAQSGPITISASENTIPEVAERLSALSGVTIRVEPGISGRATLSLTNATFETAMDSLVATGQLKWRWVRASPEASADALVSAVRSATSTPPVNVIINASGNEPAKAILTGAAARTVQADSDSLGLRQIALIYRPGSVRVAATADARESTSEENAEPETEQPANLVDRIGNQLSSLEPAEAMNILQQAQQQVFAAMGPDQQQAFLGEPYGGYQQVPAVMNYSNAPLRFNNVPSVAPSMGNVRTFQPGGPGLILNPYWGNPYYW